VSVTQFRSPSLSAAGFLAALVVAGGGISMSTGEKMPGSPRTRRCIARP
jgi:hypothetical protein